MSRPKKRRTSADRRRERRAATPRAPHWLVEAFQAYAGNLAWAEQREREPDGVVCENCLLEQPPGDWKVNQDTVTPCPNCGHEYAVTDEAFSAGDPLYAAA